MALSIDKTELQVEPGGLASCELLVKNTGVLVDQVSLTIEGPAAAWASVAPAALNLYPDDEPGAALLTFQPPRSFDTPAGPSLFVVRATSHEDPDVYETASGVLLVGPYVDVDPSLVPQTSRGNKGGQHQLRLRSRGNAPVQAALAGRDPDDELEFAIDPPLVTLAPGELTVATVDVVPRKRMWIGRPKIRPFVLESDADREAPVRVDGRHEQLPLIPAWLVKIAPLVLVPLIALIVYLATTARLPAVAGRPQQEAEALLEDAGFRPHFQFVQSEQVDAGLVVGTEPSPGGRERRGSDVAVSVSAGPDPARVPDVESLDAYVARSQLVMTGLNGRIQVQPNSDVGPGQVFATDPAAGSIVPPEYQVVLRVAPGGSDPGNRGIVDFGPVDRSTGFPAWYQDSRPAGLRLEPCLEPSSLCSVTKEGFVGSPPDGIAYYFRAESLPLASPLNNGRIAFETAVVAGFGATGEAPCDPGSCAERTFSLIRISADAGTLEPGEDYVFTHPFGTSTITANSSGGITEAEGREEVGCVPNPPQECRWEAVQTGRVGPFLVWDPASEPAAPAGYIGDGSTPHKVTGSPSDSNLFRIAGPGFGEGVATDQFIVMGKISAASTPPPGQPGVRPDPPTLTVPAQRAGLASPPQVITLQNHGDVNLSVGEVQVAGVNNEDWTLVAQNCTGRPIPAGEGCQIRVSVNPAADGPTNGEITVLSNAFGAPHKVALSGTGVAATSEAEPAQLDLGSTPAGVAVPPKNVVINNKGTAPLEVSSVEITGPAAADFQVASNLCTAAVAPGKSCTLRVGFRPTTGGQRSATLSLTTDAPVAGSVQGIALSGTGQAPSAQISPSNLDLTPGASGTVNLTSKGTSALKVTGITIDGANASSFRSAGTCAEGASIAPNASCTVEVTFVPALAANDVVGSILACHRARLVIRTDDPGAPSSTADILGRSGIAC